MVFGLENRRYRRWFLAWRTGDTEDGFWLGEEEKQEEDWGGHPRPRRRRT